MRKCKSGENRESARATKVSEGENSHAKKNYSHGVQVSEWSARPEGYIEEKRAQKGKITHSRYFGRRAMKI